jgi:transposase
MPGLMRKRRCWWSRCGRSRACGGGAGSAGVAVLGSMPGRAAAEALDRWLSWARRCRIPAFIELGRKVRRHYDAILHAIIEELSNGLIESTNTKTRLIIRRGFGFRSAEAIIALAMLCLGGNRPTLPRRQPA